MKNFKEFIYEGLTDKMVGKSSREIMKYDNFKLILRNFGEEEKNNHKDLDILEEQLPILLNSKIEDLKYFIIKNNIITGDVKGNMVRVEPYINALQQYIDDDEPEEVKLATELFDKIIIYEDKKIAFIYSVYATMVVINKNILN